MLRDHVSALCSFESPLEGLRMIDGESGVAEFVRVLNTTRSRYCLARPPCADAGAPS